MNDEPILHLAKRAIKEPESLRAFEIRKLALWCAPAARKLREMEARIRFLETLPGAFVSSFQNTGVWKRDPRSFEGLAGSDWRPINKGTPR